VRDTLPRTGPLSRPEGYEGPHRHPEEPSHETRAPPDLTRALRSGPGYERAVREASRMLSGAGIRHALVGALGQMPIAAGPRTTEDIIFLVGDERSNHTRAAL